MSETNINTGVKSLDSDHPIANLEAIDFEVRLKSGGSYLGLVAASPLTGDEYTQRRLLQKIENYIGHFYSPKSQLAANKTNFNVARIYVSIHADSDPEIFILLEKCKEWVESNNIKLIVEKTDSSSGLKGPDTIIPV